MGIFNDKTQIQEIKKVNIPAKEYYNQYIMYAKYSKAFLLDINSLGFCKVKFNATSLKYFLERIDLISSPKIRLKIWSIL